MISLAFGQPAFYVYAGGGLLILFGLVELGHGILNLLRDFRDFRAGD